MDGGRRALPSCGRRSSDVQRSLGLARLSEIYVLRGLDWNILLCCHIFRCIVGLDGIMDKRRLGIVHNYYT